MPVRARPDKELPTGWEKQSAPFSPPAIRAGVSIDLVVVYRARGTDTDLSSARSVRIYTSNLHGRRCQYAKGSRV